MIKQSKLINSVLSPVISLIIRNWNLPSNFNPLLSMTTNKQLTPLFCQSGWLYLKRYYACYTIKNIKNQEYERKASFMLVSVTLYNSYLILSILGAKQFIWGFGGQLLQQTTHINMSHQLSEGCWIGKNLSTNVWA